MSTMVTLYFLFREYSWFFRANAGRTNSDQQMTPRNIMTLLEKMEIPSGARSTERNLNVPV